jgi:MFS family permease
VLNTGVEGFGQLLSAQGLGALIGALSLVVAGDFFHKGRLLLFSRVTLGLAIGGLSLSRIPWLSLLLLVVVGHAFITQLILTNTLIQTFVPDELRGRVISTYTWALGGFYPLGSLLMGLLGDRWGAPTAAMISAVGCGALVVVNLIVFPKMRQLQ